ncbi:hypothetical protein DSCO28_15660 [Desulfosarcina ovata subsp. sediminis]|uniref:Benzylsuccinate synthase beta subunit domain-containing protein n=2 Tax=Desulfosarcina ovata TaxID=83564 RepID=A0A5K7ZPP6_9BACT|nr:benzylsuccinate synthase gamma subunit family protein [Desulfosarcina ovata]BBO81000.1 hypothetical protein DSCO28_15660 [Desulfosarcina ovata subsp. sediminis]
MATCSDCTWFNRIGEEAGDYESGKGDCVSEHQDEKGNFWLSKPVFEGDGACPRFSKSR